MLRAPHRSQSGWDTERKRCHGCPSVESSPQEEKKDLIKNLIYNEWICVLEREARLKSKKRLGDTHTDIFHKEQEVRETTESGL